MTGLELLPLRQRLQADFGFATHLFQYSSLFGDEAGTAARLAALAHSLSAPVHFLGHSLGGLLILDMFERQGASLPPGRVVLMGSPVNGAEAARTLAGWPGMWTLLGEGGQVLKRGHELAGVLYPLERRLLRAVDA